MGQLNSKSSTVEQISSSAMPELKLADALPLTLSDDASDDSEISLYASILFFSFGLCAGFLLLLLSNSYFQIL